MTCHATDDCSLILRYVPGARVLAVAGDEVNVKITTRIDLVMADRMLQMRTIAPAEVPARSRAWIGARIMVIGGTNGIGRAIAEEAVRLGARAVVEGRSTGLDVRDAKRRRRPGRRGRVEPGRPRPRRGDGGHPPLGPVADAPPGVARRGHRRQPHRDA